MRRGRRALTGLIACMALVWAGAAIAAPPGGVAGALLDELGACQDNLGASLDLGTCSNALATCTSDLGTCATALGTCPDQLDTCTGNLSTCNGELGTCSVALTAAVGSLTVCQDDLAACEAQGLPGDGQGNGAPLAYEDCGDGTVVDLNTGLMWEKKGLGGSFFEPCLTELHGVESVCDWFEATGDWIDAVNAESYAGHSDWRLPHVKELQSILDYSSFSPTMHSDLGLTLTGYWAATIYVFDTDKAWYVDYGGSTSNVNTLEKTAPLLGVRAVRDGSCP